MEDEIQYILAVSDDQVAMVLGKVNSIGGILVESDDNQMGDKIKIVCRIKPSKEKEFFGWLHQNNVDIQK